MDMVVVSEAFGDSQLGTELIGTQFERPNPNMCLKRFSEESLFPLTSWVKNDWLKRRNIDQYMQFPGMNVAKPLTDGVWASFAWHDCILCHIQKIFTIHNIQEIRACLIHGVWETISAGFFEHQAGHQVNPGALPVKVETVRLWRGISDCNWSHCYWRHSSQCWIHLSSQRAYHEDAPGGLRISIVLRCPV